MDTKITTAKKKFDAYLASENDDEFLYFKLRKSDAINHISLVEEIEKKIAAKEPISQNTFDELLCLFVPIEDDALEDFFEIGEENTAMVIERFNELNFAYTDEENKEDYSFESMAMKAILDTLRIKLRRSADKKDCITTCYESILEYRNKLDAERKKLFSHYMMTVLSGYITLLVGQEISKKYTSKILVDEPPSNEDIFRQIEKITKLYKPSK